MGEAVGRGVRGALGLGEEGDVLRGQGREGVCARVVGDELVRWGLGLRGGRGAKMR